MSDLLLVVGPEELDSPLLAEVARLRPRRVTVLLEGADQQWGDSDAANAAATRDRLARLLAAIERDTRATVVGLAGDRDQLLGWRFDRVVEAGLPLAA